jgi:hypothetical protein
MTSQRHLTLSEKIQLINDKNGGNGLSQRKLAEKYIDSKQQKQTTIKDFLK